MGQGGAWLHRSDAKTIVQSEYSWGHPCNDAHTKYAYTVTVMGRPSALFRNYGLEKIVSRCSDDRLYSQTDEGGLRIQIRCIVQH
jgi:hypothetical protein